MPSIYCVRTEPDETGKIVYRNLDVKREVLYMGVTPKRHKHFGHPPGIPMFVTADGTYLQLCNMEAYQRVLQTHGFDLLNPSFLVNISLIDHIEVGVYGNDAHFIGSDITVPVSRPKTEEYSHLVAKKTFNPSYGRG